MDLARLVNEIADYLKESHFHQLEDLPTLAIAAVKYNGHDYSISLDKLTGEIEIFMIDGVPARVDGFAAIV